MPVLCPCTSLQLTRACVHAPERRVDGTATRRHRVSSSSSSSSNSGARRGRGLHARAVGFRRHSSNAQRARTAALSSGGSGGGGPSARAVGFSGEGGGGSGSGGAIAGAVGVWAWYLACLEAQPLLTKAITALALNGIGDVFCQLAIDRVPHFDWKRLGVTCTLGLVLVGPGLHMWFSLLDRVVTATGSLGVLLRLGLDQLVWAPAFITAFFSSLLTLEGRPHEIPSKLRSDWVKTLKANWRLWLPFQFFNFRMVPPHLQVGAANICALVWNVYLSFAAHNKLVKAQLA